ncbi:MAG: diguanylate cyclase [Myxococcaceae bacterium]|nr:diguanylate cyclase [Myxococcaceae bacterium]
MSRRTAVFFIEPDDRAWVAPFCDAIGFEALTVRRPSLEQLARAAPDLVVFDCRVSMPNRWVQVLLELRQTAMFEATPVLVTSCDSEAGLQSHELRNVTHVMKPFDIDEAVKRLARLGIEIDTPDQPHAQAMSSVFDRRSASARPKSDKFRILDSPSLLEGDLRRGAGPLGGAVLYLDIDHFKQLNTQFLEREVDRSVLIPFQRLLNEWVGTNGRVYAEGGDEVIVFLPNATPAMAMALGEAILTNTAQVQFDVKGARVQLTVSIGLATAQAGENLFALPDFANEAKRLAKESGRNRLINAAVLSGRLRQ